MHLTNMAYFNKSLNSFLIYEKLIKFKPFVRDQQDFWYI